MPSLWWKSVRDLLGARWQLAGLTVLVAVVVAVVLGSVHAMRMLGTSVDACLERLAAADLDVRCSPTSRGAIDRARETPGVARAEERMLLEGVLRAPDMPATPAQVRVLPDDGRPAIFALELLDGRWPNPGEEAVLLDRGIAQVRGVGPGDTVRLEILGRTHAFPVTGVTLGSEHVLHPAHPEFEISIPGSLAVVQLSAAAATHFSYSDRIDSLLFTFEDDTDPTEMQREILARLDVAVLGLLPSTSNLTARGADMALEIYRVYMPTVIGVLVLIASVLIFMTVARLIHMQRHQVGSLLALGERRSLIALSMLPQAILPMALGWGLGALLRRHIAVRIYDAHVTSMGWPGAIDPGTGSDLWISALACLLIGGLSALLPAYAVVSKAPAKLLRHDSRRVPRRARHVISWLSTRLGRGLGLPMHIVLGARTVLRRRWVTGITAVALGGNFALILSLLFVNLSHVEESTATFNRLGLDGVAYFAEPQTEEALRAAAAPEWTRLEPTISGPAWFEFESGAAFVRLLCLPPGGWISRFPVAEGRAVGGEDPDVIHVDRWIADAHDLAVGDRVVCYPFYAAPEGVELEIAGIFDGFSLGFATVSLETGRRIFDMPHHATGLHVGSTQPREDLVDDLLALPDVESIVSLDDARAHIAELFAASRFVISLSLVMSVIVAVVFLGILASLDAAERATDLAILRAIGWRDRKILGLCVTEVSVRGFLALALALPAAPILARFMLNRLQDANGYRLPLHDPAWAYGLMVGLAVVLIPLGAVPAVRAAKALPTSRIVRLLGAE